MSGEHGHSSDSEHSTTAASVAQIRADLERLGVQRGDLLHVHASLRRIGPVNGGADGVLDALEAAVGHDGTLFMTLGARDDWDWVNDHPEAERAALLEGSPPFDHLLTPADPEVGVLAEVLRQRPGTLVNDHPDGRFAAVGRLAEHLTADGPWDDYYGAGSALERFVQAGGRVLRLGADLDTITVLHYAEFLVDLPGKRRVRRHHLVVDPDDPDGPPMVRVVGTIDDDKGIVDYPEPDYFEQILVDYLATGRARSGPVGGATSELIDAGDIVDHGVRWMAHHFTGLTAGNNESSGQRGQTRP